MMSHPTCFPTPTFGVCPGPAPCTPASPCSRPPGSLLLSGGRGRDDVHACLSSTALQREEMSVHPCWDHPAQEMLAGEPGKAGTPSGPRSQEQILFPWS